MPRTPPEHGTRRRYQYRAHPCRCKRCRAANASYKRRWSRGRRHEQLQLPDEYLPRPKVA